MDLRLDNTDGNTKSIFSLNVLNDSVIKIKIVEKTSEMRMEFLLEL